MRTDNTFLKIILGLCLVGILTSGWLLSIHVKFTTGQAGLTESCSLPIPGAPSSQGCASIAVSDYSDVFGIPLPAIAMAFYFTLLILVFWAMRNYQTAYESLYVSFFLSTLSIVVTMTMFIISRFVLKSFCVGCSILWIVNLAIWPCFVKHLGLGWGNALAANLELFRPKKLNLRRERVMGSFGLGLACLLVFSVVGVSAKGLEGQQQSGYEESSLAKEFASAPTVFLPEGSVGGPQSKGGREGQAPVLEIVEWADFQCPACRMAAQFLKPFVLKHGDKVRVTFQNFPLDGSCNPFTPNGSHSLACASARTAICAGRQGSEKFWAVHDLIFDRQPDLSFRVLEEIGTQAGLNHEQLQACLTDPATETELQRQIQWGESIQLQSTPTLVINGKKFSGARRPAEFEALLQQLDK
jgi:protein-disulfide isomerase/uncharacterized membrane protein